MTSGNFLINVIVDSISTRVISIALMVLFASIGNKVSLPWPNHALIPVALQRPSPFPIPLPSPAPATPTRHTTPHPHIPMIQVNPCLSTPNLTITVLAAQCQDPDVPESIPLQLPSDASSASEVHAEYNASGSRLDASSFDADLQKLEDFFSEGVNDTVPASVNPAAQ